MPEKITGMEYGRIASYLQEVCERSGSCSNNCPLLDDNDECIAVTIKDLLWAFAIKES
jgi:hypothetical protein